MDPESLGNLIVIVVFLIILSAARLLLALLLDEPIKDKNYKYCNNCKYCSCNALPKQEGCLKWEEEKAEKKKEKKK